MSGRPDRLGRPPSKLGQVHTHTCTDIHHVQQLEQVLKFLSCLPGWLVGECETWPDPTVNCQISIEMEELKVEAVKLVMPCNLNGQGIKLLNFAKVVLSCIAMPRLL